jgi:Spy/CpxP family protein refolding chaperone
MPRQKEENQMHPGFFGYWHARQHGWQHHGWQGQGRHGHGGHGHGEAGHGESHGHAAEACAGACGDIGAARRELRRHLREQWYALPHGADEGGGFGVRRPLRFLAHKLELNEEQVAQLATVLSALKTERAQSDVDQRRRTSALAAAFEGPEFDAAKVEEAEAEQARSAERLRQAVARALAQIHALLDDTQRKKFAYLLRTGVLSI